MNAIATDISKVGKDDLTKEPALSSLSADCGAEKEKNSAQNEMYFLFNRKNDAVHVFIQLKCH